MYICLSREAGLPLLLCIVPLSFHSYLCKHFVTINTVVLAQLSKGRQVLPPSFSIPIDIENPKKFSNCTSCELLAATYESHI